MTSRRFVIGLVVVILICCGLFAYDYFGDIKVNESYYNVIILERDITWAHIASPALVAIYIYIAGTLLIQDDARKNKRNDTFWVPASLVLTPVLAGLAYYITGLRD